MRLVEEALFLWRDAEALIDDMPPTHPERTELVWIADRLRRMTCELSRVGTSLSSRDASHDALADLRRQMARFHPDVPLTARGE